MTRRQVVSPHDVVAFAPFRPKTHGNIYEGSLWVSVGLLHLAQNHFREMKGGRVLATELLRDGLHNNTHEACGKDGASVNYPVQLELVHALLNLVYG